MNNFFVHIDPKEISYAGNSISSENYLPPVNVATRYNTRELGKRIIPSDYNYHHVSHGEYSAFWLRASDYITVSKWNNGQVLSEENTKFIFEFVDKSTNHIMVKNTSGDNIEISFGVYYPENPEINYLQDSTGAFVQDSTGAQVVTTG